MSAPRLKNFTSSSPIKKNPSANNNTQDKQMIEVLKKAIGEKMNSPELAKKAAQILIDFLEKDRLKSKK